MGKFFLPLILVFALSSCLSRVDKHGYSFEISDHDQVVAGLTTKEDVLKIMGSPTFISDLDEEIWIYYSQDVKHLMFFRPKVVERNLLALKFNRNKTVRNIERITLDNEREDIVFNSETTNVESKKIGFFKSLFSNVGQVKPQ
jgi:outer membrane protein assembly factor BamE (lipoprotein component of BamABCDE complex)